MCRVDSTSKINNIIGVALAVYYKTRFNENIRYNMRLITGGWGRDKCIWQSKCCLWQYVLRMEIEPK